MPRRPSNFTRLKKMPKDELALELDRISKCATLPYVNFEKWLESDDFELIPDGHKVTAEIIIRENTSGMIVGQTTIECVIINDNQTLFGMRNYFIYDFTDGKLKSIPFDRFTIKDVNFDE